MTIFNKRAPWLLLLGDALFFVVSLWLALFLRYGQSPDKEIFFAHLAPFSLLFVVWILVFFITGLYDKQSAILKSKLPTYLFQGQVVNSVIAVIFFYFVPWFGISPKTTLFVYLVISLLLIIWWRVYGYFFFATKAREKLILVGGGGEVNELRREIESNQRYNINIVSVIDLENAHQNNVLQSIEESGASIVAMDFHNDKIRSILPNLYNLIFRRLRFIDIDELYEAVFDRVPLSLIKHNWFLENISTSPKMVYDALKRFMDITIALILGIISLVFYPFVALAIKLEDGGQVFILQARIGENNKPIHIRKFRSMTTTTTLSGDKNGGANGQSITRVGSFMRKTRIDELPQLWNVVRGDLSLIGPRPELPQFVAIYEREIPFYGIRHLIKPGLSGWAQLYHQTPPKFEASNEDTKMKLSYDLFYIKNRSLLLDLNIALKTIREIVSRRGV
ncbi:MAG: exopolysaccharide biosynthesis polyprenyl glycosylphosphotransferase [bacterium]|nr:exopolysaccharide biosynthesis polyprenyl glycosylphosphotransferase [bacterium]